MTINNKSERNDWSKCLGWPVTSYGPVSDSLIHWGVTSIGWINEIYISVGINKFESRNFNNFLCSLLSQAQFHTGFHCFTEISQIFHNDSETQERGLLGVKKSKKRSEEQSLHLRRSMFRIILALIKKQNTHTHTHTHTHKILVPWIWTVLSRPSCFWEGLVIPYP